MKSKIKKIIDRWKLGVPKCDNTHYAVSREDFDKLEKELQKYVDKIVSQNLKVMRTNNE